MVQRASAIPATARSPAATDPMFFDAAPVKLPDPEPEPEPDPVLEGVTGAIGDPVAPAPEPEPAPEPGAEEEPVPVATGAVPVAKPVEPAIAVELMAVVFVHPHSVS